MNKQQQKQKLQKKLWQSWMWSTDILLKEMGFQKKTKHIQQKSYFYVALPFFAFC